MNGFPRANLRRRREPLPFSFHILSENGDLSSGEYDPVRFLMAAAAARTALGIDRRKPCPVCPGRGRRLLHDGGYPHPPDPPAVSCRTAERKKRRCLDVVAPARRDAVHWIGHALAEDDAPIRANVLGINQINHHFTSFRTRFEAPAEPPRGGGGGTLQVGTVRTSPATRSLPPCRNPPARAARGHRAQKNRGYFVIGSCRVPWP